MQPGPLPCLYVYANAAVAQKPAAQPPRGGEGPDEPVNERARAAGKILLQHLRRRPRVAPATYQEVRLGPLSVRWRSRTAPSSLDYPHRARSGTHRFGRFLLREPAPPGIGHARLSELAPDPPVLAGSHRSVWTLTPLQGGVSGTYSPRTIVYKEPTKRSTLCESVSPRRVMRFSGLIDESLGNPLVGKECT
jgi:hypothetical protein